MSAAERLAAVEARIARACAQAGRKRGEVTLVAVSKTKPWEQIEEFFKLGVRDFGENYVQEALAKIERPELKGARWHLIGTLQSNKAKFIPGNFTLFHALDSVSLATKLDRQGPITCFLEVNVDLEHTKGGVSEALAPKVLGELAALKNVHVKGLMAIPEPGKDPRAPFARLRELRDSLNRSGAYREKLTELSMGMSADFEAAILEGATYVRVGSILFGERK